MLKLRKVISGGQTGADQGGIVAARMYGLETGGWLPKGYKTLTGPRPDLAQTFGMKEHSSSNYKHRTWDNVLDSDGTIRLAVNLKSRGEICTLNGINHHGKPYYDVPIIVRSSGCVDPVDVKPFCTWLLKNEIEVLNVAGNAHDKWPNMFMFTVDYLSLVFSSFGLEPQDDAEEICQKFLSLEAQG